MNARWCLVTGGAGSVGSRLICTLNERGTDRIVIVDSFSRPPEKQFFRFLSEHGQIPPWITELTAHPSEKTVSYWTELSNHKR